MSLTKKPGLHQGKEPPESHSNQADLGQEARCSPREEAQAQPPLGRWASVHLHPVHLHPVHLHPIAAELVLQHGAAPKAHAPRSPGKTAAPWKPWKALRRSQLPVPSPTSLCPFNLNYARTPVSGARGKVHFK